MSKEKRSMYQVKGEIIDNPFVKNNKNIFTKKENKVDVKEVEIEIALNIITKQMRLNGNRERTIEDYVKYTLDFKDKTNCIYISEISIIKIYEWFETMDVKNSTRRIRFKSLSAVLTRFYDNGWIENKFWKAIKIKVDEEIKQPTREEDIELLMGLLDFNNFFQLRDACAIFMMWQSGIRIKTLSLLSERHIDFDNKILLLDGDIMKNHKISKLPLSDELVDMLKVLIKQNKVIRKRTNKRTNKRNTLLFITQRGDSIQKTNNTNAIRRRLSMYSEEFNLNNINPHSIRRGYALNLLKKGVSVPLISKALSHSDVAITTKYLYLDTDETLEELREYL
ncbi:tyrosine-type recombinase/integrase [Vagococcus fluvialis]|uniref:tyrosine-type recombinase/integrase n=1 Tax=Vagococcus fluvialis TaxID=2738 RepID=UPI003D0F4A98